MKLKTLGHLSSLEAWDFLKEQPEAKPAKEGIPKETLSK